MEQSDIKKLHKQEKIQALIDWVCEFDFIQEDYHSADFCVFCHTYYGNYNKNHIHKDVAVNHDKDCLYRIAWELKHEGSK